jgi:hypothetical protein
MDAQHQIKHMPFVPLVISVGVNRGRFVAITESDNVFRKPIATCPIIKSYLLN